LFGGESAETALSYHAADSQEGTGRAARSIHIAALPAFPVGAGQSAFTGEYLEDADDLVGCPPGTEPDLFAFTYNARPVAQLHGWYLFSVPRR
jgi:hypothetical protein